MKCQTYMLGVLFTVAILFFIAPNPAVAVDQSLIVTNLVQEGESKCPGGSWSYEVSWTPIIYQSIPWPKYLVKGNACYAVAYTCTASKCLAKISNCTTKWGSSWAGVTADVGVRISGARTKQPIWRPAGCK